MSSALFCCSESKTELLLGIHTSKWIEIVVQIVYTFFLAIVFIDFIEETECYYKDVGQVVSL